VTGSTDAEHGHKCPDGEIIYEIKRTPPTTANAFFKAGIEVENLVESVLKDHADEEEKIITVILNFLAGEMFHEMPPNSIVAVDQIFKAIKKFRQAQMLRDKEVEIKATTNDHQAS
jgi:hypothetical protein